MMHELSKVSVLKAALASVPKAAKSQGNRLKDTKVAVAPTVLRFCLSGEQFTAASLEECVTTTIGAKDLRAVGLALGQGVSGKGGLNLQRQGAFYLPCVENAASAIFELWLAGSLDRACDSLGYSRDELRDLVVKLPRATEKGDDVGNAVADLLDAVN